MRKALILLPGVFLGLARMVNAQTADPSLGERIAMEHCRACHEITPGAPAKDPKSGAPSFIDVARMPSTTELSIKVFLRSSHRSMPNFILSAGEIDSIAAYIVSLKK
jgi:mono/diheme cytochrome c family protein